MAKELIGHTAHYLDASVSLSGGNFSNSFLLAGSYHKESSVSPGNFSDRKVSIRFNFDHRSIDERFKIQFSNNILYDDNQLRPTDLTRLAITLAPIVPSLINSDGSLNWAPNPSGTSTINNPLAANLNRYRSQSINLLSNINFSYRIWDKLNFSTAVGFNRLETDEVTTNPKKPDAQK
ncbi:hypothetical protein [Paraflavitalea speifideaquila]|uniref:hypothetical protein n=1 Tax=Paraflavitalea speifideaquila TaxID=3076558 RepID=UPI0028E4EFAA|nr:hypothetical protein [Paraflavitalea speifideiaquila]